MGAAALERNGVKFVTWLASLLILTNGWSAEPSLLLVVGSPGQKDFEADFEATAESWKSAAAAANRGVIEVTHSDTNQLATLTNKLSALERDGETELWIVFAGHGTFDGKEARFNLAGPDLTASQMSGLLAEFKRAVILVNSTSSSAPFLAKLSATNRVIVTATKSGWEENYARFGKYFAAALRDPTSDLDKDGQVSVLEGFLSASHQANQFYKDEKRLATEHSLLDDNGDGKGTPPNFFTGVRPTKKAEGGGQIDGFRAHQLHFVQSPDERELTPEKRRRRDELEKALEQLRTRKTTLAEVEYLAELEKILLEIARIYQRPAQN